MFPEGPHAPWSSHPQLTQSPCPQPSSCCPRVLWLVKVSCRDLSSDLPREAFPPVNNISSVGITFNLCITPCRCQLVFVLLSGDSSSVNDVRSSQPRESFSLLLLCPTQKRHRAITPRGVHGGFWGPRVCKSLKKYTEITPEEPARYTHPLWEASVETNPASFTPFMSQDRVSACQLNMLRQSEKVTSSEPPTKSLTRSSFVRPECSG